MIKLFLVASIALASLRAADTPTFDVAVIRPHLPGGSAFRVKPPANGRFSATDSVVKLVVMVAYNVQESQIVGGPDWFSTEKWDIEARTDDRASHSAEESQRMLQNLLAERFSLGVHRETQQRSAYVLIVAKGGPKLKASGPGSMNVRISPNSIRIDHGEIARMTQVLATALGRPVIDRTGLSGPYDLTLDWDEAPVREGGVPGLDLPPALGSDRGSIFTAIQEQLGLRLEPQRVPVEVIVIDRIQRPSEN